MKIAAAGKKSKSWRLFIIHGVYSPCSPRVEARDDDQTIVVCAEITISSLDKSQYETDAIPAVISSIGR